MLDNKKEIITDCELLDIFQKISSKLFSDENFPNQVFNIQSIKSVYFFESWNIFDEVTFQEFKIFLDSIGENRFLLTSNNFIEYEIEQFCKELKEEKYSLNNIPVFEFSRDTNYEYYEEVQQEYYFFTLDSYIFSRSGKWGIFTNTNIDLMILGVTEELEKEARAYWENSTEKILNLEFILEDILFLGKEELIYKNYGKLFKAYKG